MASSTPKPITTPSYSRIVPLLAFVSTVVALVLSIVALVSSGQKSQLQQYDLVTFNTSTLLQDVVKVSSASTTNKRAVAFPTPTLAPQAHHEARADILSEGMSFASSVLSQATNPTATISLPLSIPTSASSLLSEFETIVNSALAEVATAIGKGLDDVLNTIIAEVVQALNIKQWYGLYLNEFCSGEYTPSYNADNATVKDITCNSTLTLNQLDTPPSTYTIASTVLDFSALNIPAKINQLAGQLATSEKALFGVQIVGIIASGFLILILPIIAVIPRVKIIRIACMALAALAAFSFGIITMIDTVVAVLVTGLVNQIGAGLGIEAREGRDILAILWVSFLCMLLSAGALFVEWFRCTYVLRSHLAGYAPIGQRSKVHTEGADQSE